MDGADGSKTTKCNNVMPGEATNRVLIVDGHAYAYRAFYAIRQLSSPTGDPTNAIYGFIKMLARMRAVLEPRRAVVVWDGGLAAARMEALPGYKAQRPPMPEALAKQIDQIVEFLAAAGVSSFCRDGVEADDWIAALAVRWSQAGQSVVIASSDKDFMQLVSDKVGLLNPNDKTEAVWGEVQVRAKTGVGPAQVVDWLSLIGDAVDNIPGISGVGPKTAAELLRQYGSVEALYGRLGEVKSERLRGQLVEGKEAVLRNQRLIRLQTDLPVVADVDVEAYGEAKREQLAGLYERWGFRTLLREITVETERQKEFSGLTTVEKTP